MEETRQARLQQSHTKGSFGSTFEGFILNADPIFDPLSLMEGKVHSPIININTSSPPESLKRACVCVPLAVHLHLPQISLCPDTHFPLFAYYNEPLDINHKRTLCSPSLFLSSSYLSRSSFKSALRTGCRTLHARHISCRIQIVDSSTKSRDRWYYALLPSTNMMIHFDINLFLL